MREIISLPKTKEEWKRHVLGPHNWDPEDWDYHDPTMELPEIEHDHAGDHNSNWRYLDHRHA